MFFRTRSEKSCGGGPDVLADTTSDRCRARTSNYFGRKKSGRAKRRVSFDLPPSPYRVYRASSGPPAPKPGPTRRPVGPATTTPATVGTRPAATARDLWMSFSRERRRRRPRKSAAVAPDSRPRSGATRPPTGCTPSTYRSRDRSCRAFIFFFTVHGSPLPGRR